MVNFFILSSIMGLEFRGLNFNPHTHNVRTKILGKMARWFNLNPASSFLEVQMVNSLQIGRSE
jgi:hypothetical protein